jgi:hypothetical protein
LKTSSAKVWSATNMNMMVAYQLVLILVILLLRFFIKKLGCDF